MKVLNGGKRMKDAIGIVFLLLGLWMLIFPNMAWFLAYGWKYKNAEPTNIALVWMRVSGVIGTIAGISQLLYGWF